jgi:hypothetical protein
MWNLLSNTFSDKSSHNGLQIKFILHGNNSYYILVKQENEL